MTPSRAILTHQERDAVVDLIEDRIFEIDNTECHNEVEGARMQKQRALLSSALLMIKVCA